MKAQHSGESTPTPTYGGTTSEAQAQPGSLNAQKHGAFGYLARTAEGEPIPATLALVESALIAEVEASGPRERVKRQALRLATAADLLWGHMLTGEKEFKAGLKHWGWLAGAEIRAWRDYYALDEADGQHTNAAKVLESIKRER